MSLPLAPLQEKSEVVKQFVILAECFVHSADGVGCNRSRSAMLNHWHISGNFKREWEGRSGDTNAVCITLYGSFFWKLL